MHPSAELRAAARRNAALIDRVLASRRPTLQLDQIGAVRARRSGIALVGGLSDVVVHELVLFPGLQQGLVIQLDPDEIGVVLLADNPGLRAGDLVLRTGRVMDIPVGDALLGRVVNGLGDPLDGGPALTGLQRWPVEREAPAILERSAVRRPLQTGWTVVDAMIPIGRGQRQLILGDRQTGKTSLAVDAILNQQDGDVICIYCAIGQRAAEINGVIASLENHGALARSVVVAAASHESPGLQVMTPYAATSIGEYFMTLGRDVLIVYDDLSHHARAYRELSLLLRRPPGREAYPGDIFYLHSRLLERSTMLGEEAGGGSLSALPIIETEAGDLSAYIPTNLISITDGQIVLSPEQMRRGILPAVDVGRSVSRVGGQAQLPALREVASQLKLAYTQFEEIERFSRFGTELEADTRRQLQRGGLIRRILQQRLHQPVAVAEQVALLHALEQGWLDDCSEDLLGRLQSGFAVALQDPESEARMAIEAGRGLDPPLRQALEGIWKALIADAEP